MVFWVNSAENIDSPKLVKFISLNPLAVELNIYADYVDGL